MKSFSILRTGTWMGHWELSGLRGIINEKRQLMKECKRTMAAALLGVGVLLLLAPAAWARAHISPYFEYAAGTENLPQGCQGKLEITEKSLVYHCGDISISIPYGSITQMEYRPRVSKRIRKMKLPWAIKPTSDHSKNEGFFTVLYSDNGQTRAIVLKVPEDTMRPYMAEIDLRTGRAIQSNED